MNSIFYIIGVIVVVVVVLKFLGGPKPGRLKKQWRCLVSHSKN